VQLACSGDAAVSLFGADWQDSQKTRILHCGIDLAPFCASVNRAAVRAEMGIAADALVLGHVGRFFEQKNHEFLVEIAAEVAKREPRAILLLVGDGPLRTQTEQKVASLGLRDRVIFAGVRADVHQLMLGAMDVFVFPSLYEGLGLVLIEAQAAGIPCVISDTVPQEADLVLPLMRRVSLSASPAIWAEALLAGRHAVSFPPQAECLRLVERSPFNISTSAARLEELYDG
jgi:glycosyltransferase involved in cell wall biosynthesis